jgi:hypothetical protein
MIDYRIDIEWMNSNFKFLALTGGFSILNLASPVCLLTAMSIKLNPELSLSEDLSILESDNHLISCFVLLSH